MKKSRKILVAIGVALVVIGGCMLEWIAWEYDRKFTMIANGTLLVVSGVVMLASVYDDKDKANAEDSLEKYWYRNAMRTTSDIMDRHSQHDSRYLVENNIRK